MQQNSVDMADDLHKLVTLVDLQDTTLGSTSKFIAHQQGLLHRAFSIFIFRHGPLGIEILLQQRATHKYHSAGLWTNACCSHPNPEESIEDAASRRLLEECGFIVPLTYVGYFTYYAPVSNNYIEHELDHVLVGEYYGDIVEHNPHEIQATKWIELQLLHKQLIMEPDLFTPWLKPALAMVSKFCNWNLIQ